MSHMFKFEMREMAGTECRTATVHSEIAANTLSVSMLKPKSLGAHLYVSWEVWDHDATPSRCDEVTVFLTQGQAAILRDKLNEELS